MTDLGGRQSGWTWLALAVAIAVVGGTWLGDVVVRPDGSPSIRRAAALAIVVPCVVALATGRRRGLAIVLVVVVFGAGVRSASEWHVASVQAPARLSGVVTAVTDPVRRGNGVSLVLDAGGRRYEARGYGRAATTLATVAAGERFAVDATVRPVPPERRRRSLVRHVIGRLTVESVDVRPPGRHGGVLARAANRVRRLFEEGASRLGESSALATGLLYGDDRAQSATVVEQFRTSGLAHLTAVSGQNVAYVLTVFGPLLGRSRRAVRLALTAVVLLWFTILTRAEPSVVRAALVAMVSATAVAAGRPLPAVSIVAMAVAIGIAVDPFLAWSVGWWMSVGGSLGLAVISPWIAARRPRSAPTRLVASTVGAQLGVLPISASVFGWPSPVSLPCNLVAAPIAGVVMLVGLPVTLVAGVVPERWGRLVVWPIGVGTRIVATTARLGAAVPVPTGPGIVLLVAAFAAAVAWCRRPTSVVATS